LQTDPHHVPALLANITKEKPPADRNSARGLKMLGTLVQEKRHHMQATLFDHAIQSDAVPEVAPSPEFTEDEFDWASDDSVLWQRQHRVAIYRNRFGDIVIRQEFELEDVFIFIAQRNAPEFAKAFLQIMGEPLKVTA
jgi:hypothetical protein